MILNKVIGIANQRYWNCKSVQLAALNQHLHLDRGRFQLLLVRRQLDLQLISQEFLQFHILQKVPLSRQDQSSLQCLEIRRMGATWKHRKVLSEKLLMMHLQGISRAAVVSPDYSSIEPRTIFDEMIDEAKLRRDASGTNPFELA